MMKINIPHTTVLGWLGAVLVLNAVHSNAADEPKATATAEAPGGVATGTVSTETSGSVSIKVSASGPNGKPATQSVSQSVTAAESTGSGTQSAAVTVTSDGNKQKVTVTTVGPDGQVQTVTNEGQEGKLPPIPLHLPGGQKMAVSLHPPPTRLEKVTYAGLVVEEVPEVLGKHLPLPKGMGLVVTAVLKDSPAEKAGIRKDDILLRFDDQLLATQDQLRKLTRSRKAGDRVRFGIVHEGRETSMEVALAEREEDLANPGHGPWQPFGWMKGGGAGVPNLREAAEQARLKAAAELRRRVGDRFEKGGEPGHPTGPGIEAVERLERELRKLREEVERSRGTEPGHSVEREQPRGGGREGARSPRGPRDGERPPAGPRDGERPPGGPRDEERPSGGQRDGERPPGGPRS